MRTMFGLVSAAAGRVTAHRRTGPQTRRKRIEACFRPGEETMELPSDVQRLIDWMDLVRTAADSVGQGPRLEHSHASGDNVGRITGSSAGPPLKPRRRSG